MNDHAPTPLTSRIVEVFLRGNLSPLFILLSLVAGAIALTVTPREEEPQIVVPVADVLVDVPGASAAEVERQVTTRLEKLLSEVDGVEYVYSVSRPHQAVVTVRFYVGEDREDSLLKLHNKLQMNSDRIPPQVASWVVKPIEIDDVPIVAATLFADDLDDYALRRIAQEVQIQVQALPDVGRTEVIGGPGRRLRVSIDADAAQSRGLSFDEIRGALRGAALSVRGGAFDRNDRHVLVETASIGDSAGELEQVVVGMRDGRPIYLREVAGIDDGGEERTAYVRFGFGEGSGEDVAVDHAAVTLTVAKRKGANAVTVSTAVQRRLAELQRTALPDGVRLRITRDYGKTADDKVNELVEGLWVAIVIVIALIALTLGWREGLIVATAVPITFALTLLINHLAGYSINRVTLFALTLALGLVVDDPIVDVENIYRHLKSGTRQPLQAVLRAVNEVRPPIILATLAVMVSFLPMTFITGMMGPYMRPMALNVPLAMFMSLVVAFTITPWLSYHMLKGRARQHAGAEEPADELAVDHTSPIYRIYAGVLRPMLGSRPVRWTALAVTAVLLVGSAALAFGRFVPLKMLPFDNKNELQVVIDLPEGSTLERTEAAAAELAARLRGFAEVVDVTSYTGLASPVDFNGMVRQYYLRREPHQADLRANLLHKQERQASSHELAIRVRAALADIASRYDARLAIVESPPGPPVAATITAEVYGAPDTRYEHLIAAAEAVAARLRLEPGVCDVDTTAQAPQPELRFVLDREKAALHGVTDGDTAKLLAAAVRGEAVTALHAPREVDPLLVELRLPRAQRSSRTDLESLQIATPAGGAVALREIGAFEPTTADAAIYRKNLQRVAYAFAEVAGRAPAEIIYDLDADRGAGASATPRPPAARSYFSNGGGVPWSLPADVRLTWRGEGEWKITVDVFRDLGLAFAAACLGIYMLLVYETRSYLMPCILMLSIPFTVIGIMPGFWLLNLVADRPVAGVANPVFFTATAMIGMIALSGIAVRNAILLIEFVHKSLERGRPLHDAILESGAVRLRPIFLTAGTAMLAAVPITLDPIFSGLAWALIFGLLVSSLFTLLLVPTVYYMVYARRLPEATAAA